MNPMRSRHLSCVAHAPRFGLYLTAVPHARISYPTPVSVIPLLPPRTVSYHIVIYSTTVIWTKNHASPPRSSFRARGPRPESLPALFGTQDRSGTAAPYQIRAMCVPQTHSRLYAEPALSGNWVSFATYIALTLRASSARARLHASTAR